MNMCFLVFGGFILGQSQATLQCFLYGRTNSDMQFMVDMGSIWTFILWNCSGEKYLYLMGWMLYTEKNWKN